MELWLCYLHPSFFFLNLSKSKKKTPSWPSLFNFQKNLLYLLSKITTEVFPMQMHFTKYIFQNSETLFLILWVRLLHNNQVYLSWVFTIFNHLFDSGLKKNYGNHRSKLTQGWFNFLPMYLVYQLLDKYRLKHINLHKFTKDKVPHLFHKTLTLTLLYLSLIFFLVI